MWTTRTKRPRPVAPVVPVLTPAQIRQKKCGMMGTPSTNCEDQPIRLFSKEQCERDLGGVYHVNGECTDPAGGSYSLDCASNQVVDLAPEDYKCAISVKNKILGVATTDCDGNPLRKYMKWECDILGGNYNHTGECLDPAGGSYSYFCRNVIDTGTTYSTPSITPVLSTPSSSSLPSSTIFGGYARRKHRTRGKNRKSGSRKQRK